MEEFKGKIVRVYAQKGDWSCIRFENEKDKKQYVAKGHITGAISNDLKITLIGEFIEDKKYGLQIQVESSVISESSTAIFLYKCAKGIGHSLAKEIVKKLGDDCVDKILADPDVLLKVKGIKAKKRDTIYNSLKKNSNIKLYIEIFNYFNNDITEGQADKIVKYLKEHKKKFKIIKKNPYILIEYIDGFGFKKVDKLAISSGIKPFSKERIGAAIIYVLQEMSQTKGHCYLTMDQLLREVVDLILDDTNLSKQTQNKFIALIDSEDEDELNKFMKKWDKEHILTEWKNNYIELVEIMAEALISDEEKGLVKIEDDRIFWTKFYNAEINIANIVKDYVAADVVKRISDKDIDEAILNIELFEDKKLSEEQKNAIKRSLKNRISIITGGPGRGKTTIIKTIIDAWDDEENVVLLAPTGKAAKRMTEATERKASTIHRYKNKTFSNPPEGKLIIVDESSMIGILLGENVMEFAKNNNLILVGDVDQLASIEPGNFLRDLIESKRIPVSFLRKGFRNDGSIARNSDLINRGKKLKDFILDDDTTFYEIDSEELTDKVVEKYEELLITYKPSDIGILCPFSVRGYGSVASINKKIREKINPPTKLNPDNGSGFLVGDRVLYTKNNYNQILFNEFGKEEVGIFNGDTGTITSIDLELEEVTVLLDDGKTGYFSYSDMKDGFILAYAITIHRSQGSEYKAIILIISSQTVFFVKRNMLYTGFTRAKEKAMIFGTEKAIAIASRSVDDLVRNTTLKERIRNSCEEVLF